MVCIRLKPFTQEQLGDTIDLIEKWQKKIYAEHGIHFIHASDEFYILAPGATSGSGSL
ncbi:MAG: DUF512 domain-containing protein [Clostridium fessum]